MFPHVFSSKDFCWVENIATSISITSGIQMICSYVYYIICLSWSLRPHEKTMSSPFGLIWPFFVYLFGQPYIHKWHTCPLNSFLHPHSTFILMQCVLCMSFYGWCSHSDFHSYSSTPVINSFVVCLCVSGIWGFLQDGCHLAVKSMTCRKMERDDDIRCFISVNEWFYLLNFSP